MLPLLLTGWIAAHGLDLVSGREAASRGAHEVVLPEGTVSGILVIEAVGGSFALHYLWTHKHKKLALTLGIAGIATHSFAAYHNFKVN